MVDAETKRLLLATAGAGVAAMLVLVAAVLPAEYGLDPTGVGALTGFSRLHEAPSPGATAAPADGNVTTQAFDAKWRVQRIPVAVHTGYTAAPYGDSRVDIPLNLTNLSSVTATLTWDDVDLIDGQRTGPDVFEVGISGPQGRQSQFVQAENSPDGRGMINASLAWRSAPAPTATEQGLLFPTHEPDTSSHGEWSFKVRLYAARGVEGSEAKDPGNNWTLTVTAEVYALEVDEREGFAGDRVSLTLRPNQGIEYKFHMEPGAQMRYQWESSAPLYWDLHAEEDGKDPEDFVRIKEGTSEADAGSFKASFAGRHGWYFLNRGAEPVTVTLSTSGSYRILGVV